MENLAAVIEALNVRREELQVELSKVGLALAALGNHSQTKRPPRPTNKTKRVMSEATRLQISRAMKKRHKERKAAAKLKAEK